jgi:hypothetical protein
MNQLSNSSTNDTNCSDSNSIRRHQSADQSTTNTLPSPSSSSVVRSIASSSDAPADSASHSVLSDVMQSIEVQSPPSSSALNGSALSGPSASASWPKSATDETTTPNSSSPPRNLSPQKWIEKLSSQIISDMNSCGICVIDNFLGESRCDVILNEVKSLYASGHFRNGQLVKGGATPSNSDIRSDKIMWVDGNESECRDIGVLMRTLDKIVRTCTNQSSSALQDGLERKHITNRTKAMLACYPGSGAQYVKHVDNPNQDGRAITCIYYLNKNWDVVVSFWCPVADLLQ